LVYDKRIVISKGVNSGNHLINQHAKSPPINRLTVPLILKNFRCEVFRGSTERECAILNRLSKSKVCQFQIPIGCN
jgi:hypothetical protein